jgi:hypothetical protein
LLVAVVQADSVVVERVGIEPLLEVQVVALLLNQERLLWSALITQ